MFHIGNIFQEATLGFRFLKKKQIKIQTGAV